jgi:hypothetical protein
VKIALVFIGYLICFICELPRNIKQERKRLVLYSIFMIIGFIETILIISIKELPSFASIIESILKPITNKIYGS